MAVQMEGGGGVKRYVPKKSGSISKPKSIRRKPSNPNLPTYRSPRAITGPVSRELAAAARSLSPKTVDVYGTGGGGGGKSGGGGGGGGGYSGGGGGYNNSYAAAQAYERQRYEQEKRDAAAQRQKEMNAARAEAKASLTSQLKLIDSAMKRAQSNYSSDRADWLGRQAAATGDLNSIYGQLIGDTKGMNTSALANLGASQTAGEQGGQTLIDAVTGRNTETETQLAAALEAMGMSGALGTEQARASEALSLAEMFAQGQKAQTTADYGLSRGAQEAVGNWNVTGLGTDRQRGIEDVNYQVNATLQQLQKALNDARSKGEEERTRAQDEYNAYIKKIAALA